MGRSDGEVAETLMDDLVAMLPQIKGKVIESDVAHWYHALPLWKPGHDAIYSNLQAPTGRIHYCGDYTGPGFMLTPENLCVGTRDGRERGSCGLDREDLTIWFVGIAFGVLL